MHFFLYLHSAKAKVAELVEHDLAKVGVASSNLVFRSNPFQKKGFIVKRFMHLLKVRNCLTNCHAQMVELVDTQDLKSCSRKRSAGSIPALSTKAPLNGAFVI